MTRRTSTRPADAGPLSALLAAVHRLERFVQRERRHGEMGYRCGVRMRRAIRSLRERVQESADDLEITDLRREVAARFRYAPTMN